MTKPNIDWNIFCECVECTSIHVKGGNETARQSDSQDYAAAWEAFKASDVGIANLFWSGITGINAEKRIEKAFRAGFDAGNFRKVLAAVAAVAEAVNTFPS